MSILRLAEMSFTRLEALDRQKTVVLFAVSPLEEHGPHLPVGVDLFTAESFNQELATRIREVNEDWSVLIGPPLPIGASAFDSPGTLLVRARTVRNAAMDYGAALARHGFRYILVTNGHGGPRHIVALEEAAAAISRRYDVRMLSVSGPLIWKVLRGAYNSRLEVLLGRPLTAAEREAMRGDAHAGLWETSLVLRLRPDLVDPGYSTLPPMTFPLLDALRRNYPLRLGNRLGYIGSPAPASAEFGDAARRVLLEAAWEVVGPVFEADGDGWQQTSVLYKIPLLRSWFPYAAACCGLLLVVFILSWLLH
jgi:creatinine amidohydrolase